MPKAEVSLDHGGIAEVLKSREMRAMVDGASRRIASHVQSSVGGMEVVTDSYTTDRAAAAVVIADLRGLAAQAERGVLTRAAKAAGAQVTRE